MIDIAQYQKCKQQRDALRRVLHRQVQESAVQYLALEHQLHELQHAARAVVKWRGSPDTPWRHAVDDLRALLPGQETDIDKETA